MQDNIKLFLQALQIFQDLTESVDMKDAYKKLRARGLSQKIAANCVEAHWLHKYFFHEKIWQIYRDMENAANDEQFIENLQSSGFGDGTMRICKMYRHCTETLQKIDEVPDDDGRTSTT